MWVSTETIYQSLYVQSRGALRRELTRYLRTGRALRKPGRTVGQRKNRIPDMINIAQRSPEADDRAVPGHWEGDLSIGKRNATAIATLIERASGFAMLVSLPDGYKPEHVAPALARKVQTLPEALRRSLTWDQGPESATASTFVSRPASRCSSATRTRPGSAAPTRTPTGCCASTSPTAPTSAR
jgi:IS30 family transposase